MELTYFNEDVMHKRRKVLHLDNVILDDIRTELPTTDIQLAVHLHLFYTDMIDYIKQYLSHIPQCFDLFISIPSIVKVDEQQIEQEFALLPNVGQIKIVITPNRGRDIAPMLCTFKEDLRRYDVFLHIHTKKSPHLTVANEWADFLYQHLLLSEEGVKRILSLFHEGIDMVLPPPFFYVDDTGWGKGNKKKCQQLLDKANIQIQIDEQIPTIEFPQGCMFFSNYQYLSILFELNLTYEDFPVEPIGADGTLAHAIERLLVFSGALQGKESRIVFQSRMEQEYQEGRVCSIQKDLLRSEIKGRKRLKDIRILLISTIVSTMLVIVLLIALIIQLRP